MKIKFLKRSFYFLTTALLLLLLVWAIKFFFFKESEPSYLTAPVMRMDIEEIVLASGMIKPNRQVNVGAQVNGQLKSLKVKLGDYVKKGQLLAEIDPVLQEYALRKAEAVLANIAAQKQAKQALLKMYEATLIRQQAMLEHDATARADLEQAQAQVESTRAEMVAFDTQIKQALIEVDTAKANLAYTRIMAPIDGEVINILTEEGQTIVSAQSAPTILVLADLTTMTVKTQISEADITRVQPGYSVYFTVLGAPNKKFISKLRAIEPAPESEERNSFSSGSGSPSPIAIYYNGLFEVANPEGKLKPSMTAQVSIILREEKNVLTIPVTALDEKHINGQYKVHILDKNHKPQVRWIQTGLNNYINVQVLNGLYEGEQVILADPMKLQDD